MSDCHSAKRNCCANGISTSCSFSPALTTRRSRNSGPKLHAEFWDFGRAEIYGRWWLALVSPLVFASSPRFMSVRFALILSASLLLLPRKRRNSLHAVIAPYFSQTVLRLPQPRNYLLALPYCPCLYLR